MTVMGGSHQPHVAREELALYMMDALEDEQKAAIEEHVFACEACAEGLAREARLEAAFEDVARRAPVSAPGSMDEVPLAPVVRALAPVTDLRARAGARHARQSRWAGGVAGALAAAAAIVLAFASSSGSGADPMPSLGSGAQARAFGDAAGGGATATLVESGPSEWAMQALTDAEKLDGG